MESRFSALEQRLAAIENRLAGAADNRRAAAASADSLARRLAESASQRMLLENLAAVFNIDATPQRVEVYDNSHTMGTNAIGAMIVAGPNGFLKNAYRKFNIKSETLTPGDDYAMMREVLERRFSRLLKADADGTGKRARRCSRS